ncbi:B-cell receptor CD22-like [Pempheris klunzingeri]|uniref:B-cell receptor CD22-like n=1 Tax=Pempheris klunzingeri TaxID=3127111 RepID=UPI00397FA210
MGLTAAAGGFVVFLLSVSVIQAQNDWGVTYTSTNICALKGSSVELHCTYRYPSRINGIDSTVERTLWFTKLQDEEPVDLRTDPQYAGRVEYSYDVNGCTLRITDLRESDSAVYKFRFITNQPGGKFIGSPGVTLTVTGFQVQVLKSKSCRIESCAWSELKCSSSCRLPSQSSYIWYKNGQKVLGKTSSHIDYVYSGDSYSCAVKGYEHLPSPSVCGYGYSCNRVTYTHRSICAFKGSSVNISSTYSSYRSITSKLWFRSEHSRQWVYQSRPKDLRKDPQYAGRVQVLETEGGRSTLRITELTERDSAQYHFKFTARSFDWRSSLPGTTLTVTDPDLQVQVIWSSTGPKLVCHSSCLAGRTSFVWFENETEIQGETFSSYLGHVDPTNWYSCAHETYRSLPVYAPVVPLLMRPPGDIMRDSSVTLTCSSSAHPPAKYTWYKNNLTLPNKGTQIMFKSIQSSDSGEYYCTAENELAKTTSEYVFVNVKYAPKLPSVSVSSFAEIVEGSSVTLTCSSDANPAANYTWYKEDQTLLEGLKDIIHFSSISSNDSGIYHCQSENQYGRINSSSVCIDVKYGPRLPSVSVSPSAEIVEGSSVNLTCSSDANPAATYTWYKEDEDSPTASGQIFTITDFRAEHSGNYYCEARNKRGFKKSALRLIVLAGAWKSAAIGVTTAALLAVILIAVLLRIRRHKPFRLQCWGGERPDNRAQLKMGPVSAAAQRRPEERQGDLHYASISFSPNEADALYSNIRPAWARRQREEESKEDDVDYTTIKTDGASSAPGPTRQQHGEDSFALYSTVSRSNMNTP